MDNVHMKIKEVDGFLWNEYIFHAPISETYVAELIASKPLYLLHDDGGESMVEALEHPLLETLQHLRGGQMIGTQIGFKDDTP